MTSGHIYIATSLDGFVARKDHSLDWLMKQDTMGEDMGYDAFIGHMDGLVMGAGSYRTVAEFDDWPYQKPVVVMSSTLTEADLPARLKGKVRFTTLSPAALMTELAANGWTRAYVDGGRLIQSFIREGLIEDLVVTVVPILIGEGMSLFGSVKKDVDLDMVSTQSFKCGMVQTHYRIK